MDFLSLRDYISITIHSSSMIIVLTKQLLM
jgi:hypothetical protein